MSHYKLLVVNPFENYAKGKFIYDQTIISNIITPGGLSYHYHLNVRKVIMSAQEEHLHVSTDTPVVASATPATTAPAVSSEPVASPAPIPEPAAPSKPNPATLNLKSTKA